MKVYIIGSVGSGKGSGKTTLAKTITAKLRIMIVFLDILPTVRTCRIIKWFIKQKLQLETANYRQTLRIF
ncbi:hypothetical protein ACSFXN_06710 [Planococcus sp. 1R117A]|uniref:hypothetical protein n=1 Tax=Planococcus sp. 1R117A TaxID=3447020 RepID=UPI003EDC86FE